MSNFNQSSLLRLLLTLLTWGLPYAALALGSPTPPDSCWQPGFGVPEGTNGEVLAMVWARGSLYIGGNFTAVGGVAARNVARWDGHHWYSLGTGADNGISGSYRYTNYNTGQRYQSTTSVHALAVAPNGDVYVGGEFAQAGRVAAPGLARWDGHHWGSVGDFRHLEEAIISQREEQAERRWDESQRRRYTSTYRRPYHSTVPLSRPVLALAVARDGTLYAGGTFQYAASAYSADTIASSVARWDGRAWTVPGQGLPGTVHALAAATDGRVYAGGDLWNGRRAEPDVRGRVACWNGTAWAPIGTTQNYAGCESAAGMPGVVHALAVLPDGTLYAAGASQSYEYAIGATANSVARWDGHTWHCFGPGGPASPSTIYALALAADGHLYAAGQLRDSAESRPRLLCWNGRAWQRLGPAQPASASSTVQALAVTPAGEVFAGGQFQEDGPHPAMRYLIHWTGQRWDNLPQTGAQGVDSDVLAVAMGPSGRVYAGGTFGQAGATPARGLAYWNSRAWTALPLGCLADSSRRPAIAALAVATDAQLYAGAQIYSQGPQACRIARWDGRVWHPLGTGLQGDSPTNPPGVRALVADLRGGVYVCGQFSKAGGLSTPNVAHWNGTAWEALGAGLPGSFYVQTLVVAPNGDLYAGGHITLEVSKASFAMVVRWNGSVWSRVGGFADSGTHCLGAGNADEVYALAVGPTGDLYVGGIFSAVDGVPAHNLARWDGTAWHAVGGDGTLDLGCQVHALALAPNGDLYVGGEFENGLPVRAHNLARWDGRAWHALGPGLNGPVLTLTWASSNRLLVSGSFTTLGNNSAAASHFAVLDPAACQPIGKQVTPSLRVRARVPGRR
jgi:hypothetical protein